MAALGRVRPPRPPDLRRGDEVVVLTGKDAGKKGTVERVIRATGGRTTGRTPGAAGRRPARPHVSVVVEGLNIAKRHTRPRQRQTRGTQMPQIQAGGILDLPQPLDVSNVMLVCPACGRPTRIRHSLTEAGHTLRTCARCGQAVDREVRK